MSDTAIILVNWNGAKDTIECLESLLRLNTNAFRIIIVDNGSTDESVEKIVAWAQQPPSAIPGSGVWARLSPNRIHAPSIAIKEQDAEWDDSLITIIPARRNLGFAAANNVGMGFAIRNSAIAYFWLLNNDTVVDRDSLTELVKSAQERQNIELFGSCLLYYHDPDTVQAVGGYFSPLIARGGHIGHGDHLGSLQSRHDYESKLDYIVGASIFLRKSCFEKTGGMSEGYFLYFEELDWAYRVGSKRQGICLTSLVYHKEGGSIGSSSTSRRPSNTSIYYLTTNLIRFMYCWHRLLLPIAILRILRESLHYWRHPKTLQVIGMAILDRIVSVNRTGKID